MAEMTNPSETGGRLIAASKVNGTTVYNTADSGDPERPFQLIMNTDSGDHKHGLTHASAGDCERHADMAGRRH